MTFHVELSVHDPAHIEPLLAAVLEGLSRTPKHLSPVWFYDEHGSRLFDRICELPEYYVTRTELAIMQEYAQGMTQHLGRDIALIEYGSGSSVKTRLLLDHLVAPRVYVPVDVSRNHLLASARSIGQLYPHVPVAPVCADFTESFELPASARESTRRVVYFPGSTIGNFEIRQAVELLRSIAALVGRDGAALIGVDLSKSVEMLLPAYDDAQGMTAAFNLNALTHLNRVAGATFDITTFEHRVHRSEAHSRIEMHLRSRIDQVVTVAGKPVKFRSGEALVTEYSHKYRLSHFARLCEGAGLALARVWTDPAEHFSVQLLRPMGTSHVVQISRSPHVSRRRREQELNAHSQSRRGVCI